MKTYTCDKCGLEIKDYREETRQIEMPCYLSPPILRNAISSTRTNYDLCYLCIADLRAWITGVEE